MTVETELIKLGDSVLHNRAEELWLPEYVMPDWINTALPTEADLVTESAIQKYPIGAQYRRNGKLYRYSKAYAAMAAVGFLKFAHIRCPGLATNSVHEGFEGAMYAAVAADATSFKIADTTALKNEYFGAYLVIYNSTDNYFDDYEVIGNDVSDGTTTTLYIASPGFKKAITTGYGITIYRNPYQAITGATNTFKSALGWAKFPITSSYFFWLQTAGRISGVTGASTWPGQTAYQRDVYCNTDGSLIGISAATYLYQRVGFLLAGTSAAYGDNLIMLQLDQ